MPTVEGKHLLVGRVISEDDKFMLLEIPKDLNEPMTIKEGDQFYTLMFMQRAGGNNVSPFIPWDPANMEHK